MAVKDGKRSVLWWIPEDLHERLKARAEADEARTGRPAPVVAVAVEALLAAFPPPDSKASTDG